MDLEAISVSSRVCPRTSLTECRSTQHNQTASPLLRLPPEIRDRIYHFAVIYDGTVNIYAAPNGVNFCAEDHFTLGCGGIDHQRPDDNRPDITLRSACRQINHEAHRAYFACNTFTFTNSIHTRGKDWFEDRHFKVPGINQITTLRMGVGACTIMNFGDSRHFNRLLADSIEDLKGLQGLSKLWLRVYTCKHHISPDDDLWNNSLFLMVSSRKLLKAQIVLEMIADQLTTSRAKEIDVYLLNEQEPAPSILRIL